MGTKKATTFAGAIVLLIGSTAAWVGGPQPTADLIVRGVGVCGTAGPVGRYTLNWVVINPEVNGVVTITSATESGEYEGEVDIEPARLPGGESGRATDGPAAGNTEGTVTLTVEYVMPSGDKGRSTGSLFLEGNCRTSRDNNGPSRVDANRPTRVDAAGAAPARARREADLLQRALVVS